MGAARVVVTGLGAVSPLGLSAGEMWTGLSAGRCGIGRIRAFDPTGLACELAGEVGDYRIQEYVPRTHRKAVKLMCRDIQLAVMAAREAVADSGLITKGIDPDNINVDPTRLAVNFGAGMISCDLVELAPAVAASTTNGVFDLHKWGQQGLPLVTPLWLLKYLPNMLACHVGIIHDAQGPSNTITCAEASGHLAVGEAAQILARRDADIALAGAAEAKVNLIMMVRQWLLQRTASGCNDHPETACRPFDAGATGSVFGEGAGVVVLESLENARNRGAKILAEIVGVGQSHNAHAAFEKLEPDGKGLQIAIEKALDDAEIDPEELDLVVPHGTGVPGDDRAETRALEGALGDVAGSVPTWPTKSMLSTTGAASGLLDLIAAVRAMNEGVIPAAQNFTTPADGCHLNIVKETSQRQIRHALCCSYTHGGQTAALVVKHYDQRDAAS
ncbi:MAG: beta-ketoacyl-[acyl-carrier-protein] synthase family protein [Sedimentisphaerales bacterium]|nr:beta-ketoacyl-[acyl-carrier-protein] synthase family protein [Sedimentisphaerales bacterium]